MGRKEPRQRRATFSARLLGILFLLALAVALLPMIVAGTDMRNALVAMAVPQDVMRITTGGATLGWFAPPSVRDLKIQDAAGQPLLTAGSLRLDRTPIQLWSVSSVLR